MKSTQAKRVNPAQKNKKKPRVEPKANKKRDRFLFKILGIFFICVIIFAILQSIFGYINNKIQTKSNQHNAEKSQIEDKKKKKAEVIPEVKPLAEDDPSLPKSYDFYYNLVNRKVSIESDKIGGIAPKEVSLLDALPPIELLSASELQAQNAKAMDTDKTEISEKQPKEQTKITFQIASFIQKIDADKFAELLNQTNLKASVSMYKTPNKGEIYQVKLGPYSQIQANQVRKTLSNLKLKPIEFKTE